MTHSLIVTTHSLISMTQSLISMTHYLISMTRYLIFMTHSLIFMTHFLQLEDEQEKFNRLQMSLLLENPDSAAFYNARMQTERRVRDILSCLM